MDGKMDKEIAVMVANGEVSAEEAGKFLLARATKKAIRSGMLDSAGHALVDPEAA